MTERPELDSVLAFSLYVTRPGDWLVTDGGRCIVLPPGSIVQCAEGSTALHLDGQHVRPLSEPLHPTVHQLTRRTAMTTDLASGPLLGILKGAAASAIFSSVAGQPVTVKALLDPASPIASIALMRSTDSGTTWTQVAPASTFDFAVFQRPVLPISDISVLGTTATVTVADTSVFKNNGLYRISGASVAYFNRIIVVVVGGSPTTFIFEVPNKTPSPTGTITMQIEPRGAGDHMVQQFNIADSTPALYKLVSTSSLGVALFAAYAGLPRAASPDQNLVTHVLGYFGVGTIITDMGQSVLPDFFGATTFVGMSSDQLLALYQARLAQLSASSITGDLTLYKRCAGGTLATLSVPAATSRILDPGWSSPNRGVLAASATVTALVDMQGNPVASDVSIFDPATVYTPGQTVTARDAAGKARPFGTLIPFEGGSGIGISGFTTKLEAAGYGTLRGNLPSPNVAALGL